MTKLSNLLLTEIESQMSCADSCICEALSELDR
jgi:hypothetical protein